MSNDHKRKLAEFVEDVTTPDVPWANAATAFVAMKKRAAAEVQHVEVGLSDRAVGLMAHMVAEKFALQAEALNCGFNKMASAEQEHARFFLRKLASARGTDWLLPEVPATKLAAMKERSITIMHHLCDELGDDPMRFTVGGFIDQDVGNLGKLAALDQVKEKRAAGAAIALVRVKQRVKVAAPQFLLHAIYRGNVGEAKKGRDALLKQGGPKQVDLASHDAYIKKHSSTSGGVLSGPDPSGMRPRHEVRDNGQYTYHDGKDEGQPKGSEKTAGEKVAISKKLISAVVKRTKEKARKATSYRAMSPQLKRLERAGRKTVGKPVSSGRKHLRQEGDAAADELWDHGKKFKDNPWFPKSSALKESRKTASNTKKLLETAFETGVGSAKRNAKRKAARIAKAKRVAAAATTTVGVGGVVASQVSESKKPKKAALRAAKIVKLAAEAGMSVEDYVGAEQQANQEMEQNELGHVRQVAEQATQQAQALSERAMQAEQQLQGVQQELQMSQQQGQMAMQQASDSEANAAEQTNAKLRMKMKIDQMRQTLADLAAVNPQMDEAPGPEAGMPQPGAPPGPVQQQADAAQQAAQQPQTAEQAKQTQQAQTAQNKAQEQTQQAQQAQQGQMGAAGAPVQGAPAAAPATPPTV